MKNLNKISIVFSLFLLLLISSCSWGNKESLGSLNIPSENKAKVSIRLGGVVSSAARSVELPEIDFDSLTFVLTCESSEKGKKSITETFVGADELDKRFEVSFGTWDFSLKAYKTKDEKKTTVMSGELKGKVISKETATLLFNMAYGDAKGTINYEVYYPVENTSLLVKVYKNDDLVFSEPDSCFVFYFGPDADELEDGAFGDGVPFVAQEPKEYDGKAVAELGCEEIEKGTYTLKLELSYSNFDETVNTYAMELEVPVIPGTETTGSYEFTNINKIYSIAYETDGMSNGSNITLPLTYKKYNLIYIPALEDFLFDGWYYKEGGNEISLPKTADGYMLNYQGTLEGDIKLYAKKKVTGNNDFSIIDPSDITITGPVSIEIDDIDNTYSTVKLSGAQYIWYWDGEEVENENDETCVINLSKFESVDEGEHTLKVEINDKGTWADSEKKVTIQPKLTVIYNSTSTDDETKKWLLTSYKPGENGNSPKFDIKASSKTSQISAFCFDSENNFYTVTNVSGSSQLKFEKYSFNPDSGFSIAYNLVADGFDVSKIKAVNRMASDGQSIFFVTAQNEYGVKFDPEKDKENLYQFSTNNTVNSIDVSADFDVVTAVACDNGYLYVAGYIIKDEQKTSGTYKNSSNEEVSVDIEEYYYAVKKYRVEAGGVNTEAPEIVLDYYDSEVYGDKILNKISNEQYSDISGYIKVSNIITDLVVKNGRVYALRTEYIAMDTDDCGVYYRNWTFSGIYISEDGEVIQKPISTKVKNSSLSPVRILAVRRKEIDFGYSNNETKAYVYTVDLSDEETKLSECSYDYGYLFDEVISGSNLEIEVHASLVGDGVKTE